MFILHFNLQFNKKIFEKVVDVPIYLLGEPIDTKRFSPHNQRAVRDGKQIRSRFASDAFLFFSVFKFEERKGYRTLFEAFLTEFRNRKDVVLIVLTSAYHS